MKVHIHGNQKNKVIILLHPMLLDGATIYNRIKDLFPEHCIIAPDLSSHGEDSSTFISCKEESAYLEAFLRENSISHIELLYGMSLGARVALELIQSKDLSFGRIFLDGTPVYRNYHLGRIVNKVIFHSKQRKALRNPGLSCKKLSKLFGEDVGELMSSTLENMSPESFKNILRSVTRLDSLPYPKEIQEKMHFDYGSKEFGPLLRRNTKKYFPYAHCSVRKGYGHCEYVRSHKEYIREEKIY